MQLHVPFFNFYSPDRCQSWDLNARERESDSTRGHMCRPLDVGHSTRARAACAVNVMYPNGNSMIFYCHCLLAECDVLQLYKRQ